MTDLEITLSAQAPTVSGPSMPRRLVCWATAAAAAPYLCLKLVWLCGGSAGIANRAALDNRTLAYLNAMTMAMDAVAALIAFALAYPWGRRVPARLLVPPMWVASGLLGAVLAVLPVQLIADAGDGTPAFSSGLVEPWVYGLVYGGFAVQGLGLLTGFALYSRARWPWLRADWALAASARDSSAARLAKQLLTSLAPLCVLSAVPLLYWGFTNGGLLDVGRAVGAVLAAGGALGLRREAFGQVRERRIRRPLLEAWFGTAVMATWGLWTLLTLSTSSPLSAAATDRGPQMLVGGAQALFGCALALIVLRMTSRLADARI